MDVGVRELKAHLSEMLDRAERGEVLRVTTRGRPKATLGPVPGQVTLARGVAEGWVHPGRQAPVTSPRRRFRATRTVAELLAEERHE